MKRAANVVGLIALGLVGTVWGQAPAPVPPPEMKKWDLWVGDWKMVGTAKDSPADPEYKLDWQLHGSWILDGFFVEVSHSWKGKGAELRSLEILSYDPVHKGHANAGFSSDGTTWAATITFDNEISVENGTQTSPDGKVTTWRVTWVFSADRMAISGKQECEQDGKRWTCFTVTGTRTKAP